MMSTVLNGGGAGRQGSDAVSVALLRFGPLFPDEGTLSWTCCPCIHMAHVSISGSNKWRFNKLPGFYRKWKKFMTHKNLH